MKVLKIIVFLILGYLLTVAAFESWLAYSQPSGQSTLLIITTDSNGTEHERVLSRINDNGNIYVSANHWPRRWYKQALARPEIKVKLTEESQKYRAVPVEGEKNDRLQRDYKHSLGFRILTGFPPRYFLRLDKI